jgi:effector-binding domain-containing protein
MTVHQIPIGKFSTITRLTQKALRYYDNKGLLVPRAKDPFTGYRYYTGEQIQIGIRIKFLSILGFSINEIADYLQAISLNDDYKLKKLIDDHLQRTERELKRLQRVTSLLDKSKNKEMMKEIMSEPIVKDVSNLRVLSKREKGEIGPTIGKLIGELMVTINLPENKANFVKIVGPFMTIYHDHEYKEMDADLEVAIPITGKIMLPDQSFEVKNWPARKVVSLIHKGTYETIGMAYAKLFDYINSKGYETHGPMIDVYLNDPNAVDPSDILTEIQTPIKS